MSPDELIKGKQSEGGKQPSVCKLKHPRTGMKTQTADVEKSLFSFGGVCLHV